MKSQTAILILFFLLASCSFNSESSETYVSEDFVFVGEYTLGLEGPAVDKKGNLFFVNPYKNGSIGKVSVIENIFEIFIDSLPNGSVANGIRFDKQGIMYLADYTNHNILSINVQSKEATIFASDTSMNQPNDIAIASNGTIYASDPDWQNETGNIWRIDTNGEIVLLAENMGTTNGIEVAPGDSILYVNESVQRKIWRYDLSAKGIISNKTMLFEFTDHGLDGMRCDDKGNLYVARYGKGVIAVIAPSGNLLREIELKGQKPTNIAFGGKDGKTCFITCQDRRYIERFKVEHPGRSFIMNN